MQIYGFHTWFRALPLCGLLALATVCEARVVDGNSIMDQRMNENLCALTFDDGPSRNTAQLLDTLNTYGIPATFFLLGKQAEIHPDLVRRILAEGHEVGNHSYSHPNLRVVPMARKYDEITRTDAILRNLGANPAFMRPPYGNFDAYTVETLDSLGVSLMLWSVDSRDWKRLPANYALLRNTRGSVYPQGHLRGIFLFHDTHKNTVDDLPRIINDLRAGGCQRFVTASEYMEGVQDPEPALLMTRRSPATTPATAEMPLVARHEVEGVQSERESAQATAPAPYPSWPAGSGPVPLARSRRPFWSFGTAGPTDTAGTAATAAPATTKNPQASGKSVAAPEPTAQESMVTPASIPLAPSARAGSVSPVS